MKENGKLKYPIVFNWDDFDEKFWNCKFGNAYENIRSINR